MKKTKMLSAMAMLVLSLAVITTQALAVSGQLPGGTSGNPKQGPTPTGTWQPGQGFGPPPNAGSQNVPGAQVTAQALRPKGRPSIYRGTITAVDASNLTLALSDGSSVTIGLTPDTRILVPGANAQGNNLLIGMQVIVWAFTDDNGNPIARAVVAIPGKPALTHRVGTVTEYTPGTSIKIQANDGQIYTFNLTADTKILPPERAGALAVGSLVTIIAPRDPSALEWTAIGIVVHPSSP